jgi:filamentous hemagglutinin family protein
MDNSSIVQRRGLSGAAARRSPRRSFFALTLGASYGLFCAGQVGALPGTPTIQNPGTPASNATFASTATTLTVNQLVQNLAIVWTPNPGGNVPTKAFDILSGETVTFMQPTTTSVAYNAISCAGCSATQIAGTLQSRLTGAPAGTLGGRVWLFDPNGIVIGQGAIVNVGGFVASTLQGDIPTWLANPNNPITLSDGGGATPTNGAVTNDGNITAKDGVNGYVALIGNSVAATHTGATGSIDVGFGSINLAAGRVATITALNTGGLNFALSAAAGDAINVNNGTAISAVANSGALTGATVTLSANVANALFASAVNTSGVIRAVNLDNSGGTIKLVGAGSPVVASGTLDASGATGTDPVGTVQITGDSVSLGASTVHGTFTATSVAGDITETGAVTADAGGSFTSAGNIDLSTQANDLKNPTFAFTGATGNLGYRDINSIVMPATNLHGGNITLISDTGSITQTVGSTITATAGNFTTSAADQAITLGNAGNTFTGAVSLNTAGTGNATIEAATLNLGTSNVGGTLAASPRVVF